jgi:hypothetical protein
LFGQLHDGFYHTLFSNDWPTSKGKGRTLYRKVVDYIRLISNTIKCHHRHSILPKVYLTGHSLGGALAGLCHARFLKDPSDISSFGILSGAYTFGSPRSGDLEFFTHYTRMAKTDHSAPDNAGLWRVYNTGDIVPRSPGGIADLDNPSLKHALPTSHKQLASTRVIDYAHYGNAVHIDRQGWIRGGAIATARTKGLLNIEDLDWMEQLKFSCNYALSFIAYSFEVVSFLAHGNFFANPIKLLVYSTLPMCLIDHQAASYYKYLTATDYAK